MDKDKCKDTGVHYQARMRAMASTRVGEYVCGNEGVDERVRPRTIRLGLERARASVRDQV